MKRSDTPSAEKMQALATLEQGIARLDTFTYNEATSEAFLAWRAQMLQTLTCLVGENALAVFEWRVLRFEPVSVRDEAHAAMVWKYTQNYARLLLREAQRKQQS